ncbi:hypothetical protein VB737_14655, partial [Synechococcus sp. BA-120 BA3]|nr:hypothetical protein [Synechococcus sp. BA-120 BA3]
PWRSVGSEMCIRDRPRPLAWGDEHASSWAAGERFGLHGDRSGRLDSAAAVLLLEQWLREGPEPLDPAAFTAASTADPVAPAAIAVGSRAGADSF